MTRIERLGRVWRTVRFLKARQVFYRLWYLFLYNFLKGQRFTFSTFTPRQGHLFEFKKGIESRPSMGDDGRFTFLNQAADFSKGIDWTSSERSELWRFNLHYFDFLHQPSTSFEKGAAIIDDYCRRAARSPVGLDPFVVSLKIGNWTKFFSLHRQPASPLADGTLFAQTRILCWFLEYELLGNHLLENGFGLFFAAHYFRDERFYKKARRILLAELSEQVLPDGGHFELSPMYHATMLQRVLDCTNLTTSNRATFGDELLPFFTEKAGRMLGWLQNMTLPDGSWPMVNDSAPGIAPTTRELLGYAKRLGIEPENLPLKESGYRRLEIENAALVADVGQIGPDYIPGHAHSDTLSFTLSVGGLPFIVDTGVSTYEKNDRRQFERSTAAHNTVQIDGEEQSEIWGGFRVGRRAWATILEDRPDRLAASHSGYEKLGISHLRRFATQADGVFVIEDVVEKQGERDATARFHFYPELTVEAVGSLLKTNLGSIAFENADDVRLENYDMADGFNRTRQGLRASVWFRGRLMTTISMSKTTG